MAAGVDGVEGVDGAGAVPVDWLDGVGVWGKGSGAAVDDSAGLDGHGS